MSCTCTGTQHPRNNVQNISPAKRKLQKKHITYLFTQPLGDLPEGYFSFLLWLVVVIMRVKCSLFELIVRESPDLIFSRKWTIIICFIELKLNAITLPNDDKDAKSPNMMANFFCSNICLILHFDPYFFPNVFLI